MTPKELAFKLISDRIDNISQLVMEGIELIWRAAYNEAIEDAALRIDQLNREGPYQAIIGATEIRKLKK